MKFHTLSLLFLLSILPTSAIEEVGKVYGNNNKPISQKNFDTWDFTKAIRALGNPPGPVLQSTYDMLRSTWKMDSYYKRDGRQHYLMLMLMKNGQTTDMNTWMLIRANSIWLNHSCSVDRRLFFTHLIKPYEQEKPQELPHQLKWVESLDYHPVFKTPYLLGIISAQRGIPATLIERVNPFTRTTYLPAEINRLWSDPVAHAPFIMHHGSTFARHTLRFLLHDSSAIYESARHRGLTCWNYTWGRDLPEPIAQGLLLMQKRNAGLLPTREELSTIRKSAEGLPQEMQGFIVRNMLVADPTCMPWKKLDDPGATLAEMPDCSAVRTAQWDDSLLGETQGIEADLAALDTLTAQEQEQDMLSSLVLFTLAEGARTRKDNDLNSEIPTQGHFRVFSSFDVEISENGIDVLIDEKGPRFASKDEEMRRRSHRLNVSLHRCALRLALLERDGKTEELTKYCAALAELLNRHRIWPLLLNEAALRELSPECKVLLLKHCKAGDNILRSMVNIFSGGCATTIYNLAQSVTQRRDEDNKPDPEPELLASFLRDCLIDISPLLFTPEQLTEMQKRWLELDDRFPKKSITISLFKPGYMNDTLYSPSIEPYRFSGESSRRGYFLISHALKKGDVDTAKKLLSGMTADPKMYRHLGTRLAAALVARAGGDEAAAREHERWGITQAAMQQFSYYIFHCVDAHRLLLEHGFTQVSERLLRLTPDRELNYILPYLAEKLAEQRKFRSAAFTMELLLARFCSYAAPFTGLGTQADLITWRLRADVYHALALLQQGKQQAANTLLNTAVAQLERMPEAAALSAPALLTCADIPADTRRSYRERLLRGAAAHPAALAALQQVPQANLPTVDESDEVAALQKIREPEGVKPLESPYYTWHLQKQGETDEETEQDERTATRVTIDARIISTVYGQQGLAPQVELETETGRKFKVEFDDLQADDLANIIDWKERNNIRTWVYRKTKYTGKPPFDARLDRMVQGKSGGKHLRNGIDVSDGRLAEFTLTDGTYLKLHVNLLDDEAVSYIEQFPIKEKAQPHLHSSLSEAEADAVRRNVALRIFMLGKRGGPEEADFRNHLSKEGVSLQENNALLVCYKDDKGEWEESGQAVMQILNHARELYETPGENSLSGGFALNISRTNAFRENRPAIFLYRYGNDASNDPDYKALTEAIRKGNRARAEQLLNARPELVKAHSYYTGMNGVISTAILNRKPDMLELMLQRGANPNTRTADGHTVLFQAAFSPEMLRILLKYGARHDMLSRELNGNCIHTLFAARKHPEAIKVLLEHGVDPNTLNEEGENILHSLINSNMQIDGNALIQLAKFMVPAGLDINATDAMGRSLLYKVAECAALNAPGQAFGKPEQHELMLRTMKELIDLGADPEESSGGFPPLLDRLKNAYTPTINTELCPEVEQILREYRRKPQN